MCWGTGWLNLRVSSSDWPRDSGSSPEVRSHTEVSISNGQSREGLSKCLPGSHSGEEGVGSRCGGPIHTSSHLLSSEDNCAPHQDPSEGPRDFQGATRRCEKQGRWWHGQLSPCAKETRVSINTRVTGWNRFYQAKRRGLNDHAPQG